MSQFIESIKIENGKLFLLDLHQKRVNETFAHFTKKSPLDLFSILENTVPKENGLFKMRIVYDLEGNFTSQLIPYTFKEIQNFKLVENNTIDYSLKFEAREVFTEMKITSNTDEIIIVKNNSITDSSYSNLIFLKDRQWFTPHTYLLNGVQRKHLLNSKMIEEMEISLKNIQEFSHFKIINAMNDIQNNTLHSIEKIINLNAV